MALSVERIQESTSRLAADLKHIFDDRGAPPVVQAYISELGLTTTNLFALMADTRIGMRGTLKEDPFNLDPEAAELPGADTVLRSVTEAKVLDAWETVKARVHEKTKVQAEQRASEAPFTLTANEHVALRRSLESKAGRTRDADYPADFLVERRCREPGDGKLWAEPLRDAVSQEEMGDPWVRKRQNRPHTHRFRDDAVPCEALGHLLPRRVAATSC